MVLFKEKIQHVVGYKGWGGARGEGRGARGEGRGARGERRGARGEGRGARGERKELNEMMPCAKFG